MISADLFKVAPYSFTIVRALKTKAQVMRALKGKRQCFVIFYYVNVSKKSKTESEFSSISFLKTWQTGSKCFTLVGAHFSGKSIRPLFS